MTACQRSSTTSSSIGSLININQFILEDIVKLHIHAVVVIVGFKDDDTKVRLSVCVFRGVVASIHPFTDTINASISILLKGA